MKPLACHLRMIVGGLALIAVAVSLSAAPARGAGEPQQGTRAFSAILKYHQLRPLEKMPEVFEDPSRTLLIVFGDTEILGPAPIGFVKFIERQGAVLLATDRRFPANWPTEQLGFSVNGTPVSISDQAPLAYRKTSDCPLISDFAVAGHPLFRGLQGRIATNRPSYLLLSRRKAAALPLTVLARFPESCRTPNFYPLPEKAAFAAARSSRSNRGPVLVLADHSVFIDEMMLQRDNENFDFAFNCLEWLTEDGHRDRVLFVDQGRVHTDFDAALPNLPLPDPPLPSQQELVSAMNQWIREVERTNFFNRLLQEMFPLGLLQPLAFLLTAALVAYGIYRLHQGRHRREPLAEVGWLAPALPAPGLDLLGQRHRSMLRQGNLWEAARALARQGVEAAAGGGLTAAGSDVPVCPRITVSAGPWWRRWRLRRLVNRLWEIGFGPRPRPVSRRQFSRLSRQVREVTRAAANGALHLSPALEPGGQQNPPSRD
jgi:hypothetical protein